MKTTENNVLSGMGSVYRKWYLLALTVAGVALAIGFCFSLILDKDFSFFNVFFPSIFNTVVLWTGGMTIVRFTWKRYPWETSPGKHLWVEIALIILMLAVYLSLANAYFAFFHCEEYRKSGIEGHIIDIVITTLITFLIVTIHEAVFFYKQWKYNFSKSVALEKDNLEARYNALKAQINPHFLFNSLNSLISQLEDNPSAEEHVQDLSDFLRYVLQSGNRDTVSLREELETVEKYLRIQHRRFEDHFEISIRLSEAALEKHIPPLSLQMLLENCFNHNVITESKPLKIRVFDSADGLTVENTLQVKPMSSGTGQGLKNIEGRYRFSGAENIRIVNDGMHFSVTIPLIDKTL